MRRPWSPRTLPACLHIFPLVVQIGSSLSFLSFSHSIKAHVPVRVVVRWLFLIRMRTFSGTVVNSGVAYVSQLNFMTYFMFRNYLQKFLTGFLVEVQPFNKRLQL